MRYVIVDKKKGHGIFVGTGRSAPVWSLHDVYGASHAVTFRSVPYAQLIILDHFPNAPLNAFEYVAVEADHERAYASAWALEDAGLGAYIGHLGNETEVIGEA